MPAISKNMQPAKDPEKRIEAFRETQFAKYRGVCYSPEDIVAYIDKVFVGLQRNEAPEGCKWAVGHYFAKDSADALSFIISPVLVDSDGKVYDYTDEQYGAFFKTDNPDFFFNEGSKWP